MILINIISLGIYVYVLTLALHNYFTYRATNGANTTRRIFIGNITALTGIAFCLLISGATWPLIIASVLNMYTALGALVFYKHG
jgi:hypothetical protein